MRMPLGKTFIVLGVILAALSRTSLSAQNIEISADLRMLSYSLEDTNNMAKTREQTIRLTCVAGTNSWEIKTEQPRKESWSFDGTKVSQEVAMIRHAKTWKSADGFPIGVPFVNLAWLAFCSGDYLKRDGRLVALPLNDLHHCPDRYAYRDITTTFDDAGGLPRTIDLFTSKERFLASHTQWDKEMSFGSHYTEWNQKTAAKIQDGLLMFHYAVTETTNVLGRTFPLKFEFFQSGRPYEENANWLTTGTGQVTSIHSVDQAK